MGIFDHLFGTKKSIAHELLEKTKNPQAIWKELENMILAFKGRSYVSLCYSEVDRTVANFSRAENLLNDMETQLLEQIVDVDEEVAIEEEVSVELTDFIKLSHYKRDEKLWDIVETEKHFLMLFKSIKYICRQMIDVIRLIRQDESNRRANIIALFEYIKKLEELYIPLTEHLHSNPENYKEIIRVATAVLRQEEIKERFKKKEKAVEDKFVTKMVTQMSGLYESHRSHRKLAESIFLQLIDDTGFPSTDSEELLKHVDRMEKLLDENAHMYALVKRLRPRYDDEKIRIVIEAFRIAYAEGNFDNLGSAFAT